MTDLLGWPAFLCATASLLERAGRCAAGPMSPRCANVTTNSDVGKMRHEKAEILLRLARALAASAEGLTLEEMAREAGVGRRTAERMRDALWALFPQMEEVADPPTKRFRIPQGLDGLFQNPSAEELAELSRMADSLAAAGAPAAARESAMRDSSTSSSALGFWNRPSRPLGMRNRLVGGSATSSICGNRAH